MMAAVSESAVQRFTKETKTFSLAPQAGGELPWAGATLAKPILFQFAWRERLFRGSIAPRGPGCRVALATFLARHAPGPRVREGVSGSLVAVIDVDAGQSLAQIKLVAGSDVLLDDSFSVPAAPLAVDGLVTSLTLVVLAAAPYLDLLTEAARPRASSPGPVAAA